jgi:hypothetical protein
MWRRADLVWTDASQESIASIFKVEKSASEEPAWAGGSVCSHLLTLVPRSRIFHPEDGGDTFQTAATCSRWFLARGFFTLKMKAIHSRLQPPAHAGSSLTDSSTLKMETICSSETSVQTRSTQRHIPENDILHSHRREDLKSHIWCHFTKISCIIFPFDAYT